MSRKTILTKQGLNLLAKAQAGATLHFTRAVLGDGRVEESADLKSMTAMVSEKMELPIGNITVSGTGTATIETQLENNTLEHGFFAREAGIFARADLGDTQGEEVLYAYRNTGDDCEYVPAGGGSEVWNLTYNIITVVDNAENITATISGDIVYVSYGTFTSHKDSEDPHPKFLKVGSEVNTADYVNCSATAPGDNLQHISMDNLRKQIMGGNMASIALITSRLNQAENELSAIALKMEAENLMPDSNTLLAENFINSVNVDQLEVDVKSCAAGDNSIDVASNYGILIGSHYWITDSVHAEYVQVKSVIKNGSTYRLLLTENLVYTYDIPSTKLYRTTSWINAGIAHGSGDIVGQNYQPGFTWKGTGETSYTTKELPTSQAYADNFESDTDIIFTSGNQISLA